MVLVRLTASSSSWSGMPTDCPVHVVSCSLLHIAFILVICSQNAPAVSELADAEAVKNFAAEESIKIVAFVNTDAEQESFTKVGLCRRLWLVIQPLTQTSGRSGCQDHAQRVLLWCRQG